MNWPSGTTFKGPSAPVDSLLELNTQPMLIQHSVHINRPIEAVSSALATAPPGWLPSLVGPSPGVAGEAIAEFGIRTKVSIELGEPVTSGMWTEIPITWQASSIKHLYPLMTGTIEVAPNEGRATTLTVYGSYDSPTERLGALLGEDLVRRVAEATVKEVAESIAKRLEEAAATY
jgi:hypothetical protein